MMFCGKCGNSVGEGNLFCTMCGANIEINPNDQQGHKMDFEKRYALDFDSKHSEMFTIRNYDKDEQVFYDTRIEFFGKSARLEVFDGKGCYIYTLRSSSAELLNLDEAIVSLDVYGNLIQVKYADLLRINDFLKTKVQLFNDTSELKEIISQLKMQNFTEKDDKVEWLKHKFDNNVELHNTYNIFIKFKKAIIDLNGLE